MSSSSTTIALIDEALGAEGTKPNYTQLVCVLIEMLASATQPDVSECAQRIRSSMERTIPGLKPFN